MSIKKDDRINGFINSAHQKEAVPALDVGFNKKKMQFESDYKDWINGQNMQFEYQGLWCDDSRLW
ncbi:hypothetical protein [Polynucleobacter sp.]|uniref:hypothetical protein n=1 Tax=Polynucleobacter sp. TaxID=2029855 RepID=UPI00273712A2|nr:hypothetical protein [Polynucleobacter sp.]MDP3122767.1 hypothetical protein [Polynucleobacter sp.]